VTREGVETAVLVSVREWRHLQSVARPSPKDLLLAPYPRFEGIFEGGGRFGEERESILAQSQHRIDSRRAVGRKRRGKCRNGEHA